MYLASISSYLLLYNTKNWVSKKCHHNSYSGALRDVSWSDDGKYLLQIDCNGLTTILRANDQDIRTLQHIPLKHCKCAYFQRASHKNIAIGTENGSVVIWDTKNKNILEKFPSRVQNSSIHFISYNSTNSGLAAYNHGENITIYSVTADKPTETVVVPFSKTVTAMKFHHNLSSLLGLSTGEGNVILKDIIAKQDKLFIHSVDTSPVSDFAYSLVSDDVVISCGYDKNMHVYDLRMQNIVSTTETSQSLTSVAINKENLIALGAENGMIWIYDLRYSSNPTKTFKDHTGEVTRVSFQPMRDKIFSNEESFSKNFEITSALKDSLVINTDSDFFNIDTPLCTSSPRANNADSFLVSIDMEDTVNLQEAFLTHSVSNADTDLTINQQKATSTSTNADFMKDFKDFVKHNLSDFAKESQHLFLHALALITKENLELEKKMSVTKTYIQTAVENQNKIMQRNNDLISKVKNLKNN